MIELSAVPRSCESGGKCLRNYVVDVGYVGLPGESEAITRKKPPPHAPPANAAAPH